MNTRISSGIETSVYVLVTVMTPRYSSRSKFFPPSFKANPAPEEPERGPALTENGTQYPGPVYSEVNTPLTIDASGISGTHPIALATILGDGCRPTTAPQQ